MNDEQTREQQKINAKLQSKLDDLEARLVAQEHRRITTITNLYTAIRDFDGSQKSKAMSVAAFSAFVQTWIFRSSMATITVSAVGVIGTIIAVFTLVELTKQNDIVAEQNVLFRQQNLHQISSTNNQAVADLIGDLYSSKQETDLKEEDLWTVPQALVHRIALVAESLSPYDSVTYETLIFDVKTQRTAWLSRERGTLLAALLALRVDFPLKPNPNFTRSYITSPFVSGADLQGIRMSNSSLTGQEFFFVDFTNSDLSGSDLAGSDFTTSNFMSSNLSSVNVAGTKFNADSIDLEESRWVSKPPYRLNYDSWRETAAMSKTLIPSSFSMYLLHQDFPRTYLDFANLSNVDFSRAVNIDGELLVNSRNVDYKLLPEEIAKQLDSLKIGYDIYAPQSPPFH